MKRIINLSQERRQLLFETTAREMKVSSVIVEKDFWVCVVLNYLLNESQYKDYFIFKGGTSLSKCYDVIKRFSEDVDLILRWDKIGFKDEDVFLSRSKNQDHKFETLMNKRGSDFIQNELKEDLSNNLAASIKGMKIESNPNDPMILLVYYPNSYKDDYIEQAVKLEIGPVAAKAPTEVSYVEPYCFRYFNVDNKKPFEVNIVTIARTFWEKLLILFAECNRPLDKKTPNRYSRHYYDIYMIYKSKFFKDIVNQKDLFEEVKLFKTKYYRTSWSDIEGVTLNNFALLPSKERLEIIELDYKKMREMFFETPPSFEEVINGLKQIEEELKTN